MVDDLIYDELDRHLHAALRALADDNQAGVGEALEHATKVWRQWEQRLRTEAMERR